MKSGMAWALAAMVGLGAVSEARAQGDYPNKPVRVIVAYPAGGSTDITARLLGERLSRLWNQQVIVDNKSGAAGTIGADQVAKAPPDGYMLLAAASPEIAISRSTQRNLPYDPIKDFAPISLLTIGPFMLVVAPQVPASNLQELIALAKAKPNSLNFASYGVGTSNHLVGELFKATAGLDIVHVPYRGSAPALTDLTAGQVQLMFDTIIVAMPHVRDGRLKAIAVATPERTRLAPDVPTMSEAGLPGFTGGSWVGLLAPARTPPAIVEKLGKDVAQVMREGLSQAFADKGLIPADSNPAAFARFIEAEVTKWSGVAKTAGIQPE